MVEKQASGTCEPASPGVLRTALKYLSRSYGLLRMTAEELSKDLESEGEDPNFDPLMVALKARLSKMENELLSSLDMAAKHGAKGTWRKR